ncbi:MAG: hypothetical protein GY838_00350 [bacterium]|nr:hypothetical protein [bacterium]
MKKTGRTTAKGCAILAAALIGIPLLVAGVVGVKTWGPLQNAGEALNELDRSLGSAVAYVPPSSGGIPAERMELFLDIRSTLVASCEGYGNVRRGFDAVASLETRDPEDVKDAGEMGGVAAGLGGAALSITPFLANYFEKRNTGLLAASMGLEEYSYIYAVAYHDQLLSEGTRGEIFSNGEAVSPEAAERLSGCLARQLQVGGRPVADDPRHGALADEVQRMEDDSTRLVWQDGLPATLQASVAPYRERLDAVFCSATAGLEMERSANRALRLALE